MKTLSLVSVMLCILTSARAQTYRNDMIYQNGTTSYSVSAQSNSMIFFTEGSGGDVTISFTRTGGSGSNFSYDFYENGSIIFKGNRDNLVYTLTIDPNLKYAITLKNSGNSTMTVSVRVENMVANTGSAGALSLYQDQNKVKVVNAPTNCTSGYTIEFWIRKLGGDLTIGADGNWYDNPRFSVINTNKEICFEYQQDPIPAPGQSHDDHHVPDPMESDLFRFYMPKEKVWNKWKHVVFAIDNNSLHPEINLYIDGELRNTNHLNKPIRCEGLANLVISATNTTYNADITLDEFRIWSECRTAKEISDNFNKHLDISKKLPSSLELYYDFDQGVSSANNTDSTVVFDRTTNNRNGSLVGFTLAGPASNWVGMANNSGLYYKNDNYAWPLTGMTDQNFMEIQNPYRDFASEITVSFWIKLKNVQTGAGIGQGKADAQDNSLLSWNMHFWSDGRLSWGAILRGTSAQPTNGLVTYNKNLNDGSWHHVAGTVSQTATVLYIDGEQVVEGGGLGNEGRINWVDQSVIQIGKDVRYSSGRFMNGSIDELRIYNRALTSDEIASSWNCIPVTRAGSPSTTNGLVMYYDFSQANGHTTSVPCSSLVVGGSGPNLNYKGQSGNVNATWIYGSTYLSGICP